MTMTMTMTMTCERSGCQKVEDMPLHHITSIRSARISMYYTHTHSVDLVAVYHESSPEV